MKRSKTSCPQFRTNAKKGQNIHRKSKKGGRK